MTFTKSVSCFKQFLKCWEYGAVYARFRNTFRKKMIFEHLRLEIVFKNVLFFKFCVRFLQNRWNIAREMILQIIAETGFQTEIALVLGGEKLVQNGKTFVYRAESGYQSVQICHICPLVGCHTVYNQDIICTINHSQVIQLLPARVRTATGSQAAKRCYRKLPLDHTGFNTDSGYVWFRVKMKAFACYVLV